MLRTERGWHMTGAHTDELPSKHHGYGNRPWRQVLMEAGKVGCTRRPGELEASCVQGNRCKDGLRRDQPSLLVVKMYQWSILPILAFKNIFTWATFAEATLHSSSQNE